MLKKDGVGQYKDKVGNLYQGQWVDDQRCGFGRQTYATGERYHGTFDTNVLTLCLALTVTPQHFPVLESTRRLF